MPKQAAGIIVYRTGNKKPEIFLCHPGGPFFKNKDLGVWQFPKGEFENDEEPIAAAKREFKEETGQEINGEFISLAPVRYKNGKMIYAWAVKGEVDAGSVTSNTFSLEWPPKSGKYMDVPEMDRAEWFAFEEARKKILPALVPFLDELAGRINE